MMKSMEVLRNYSCLDYKGCDLKIVLLGLILDFISVYVQFISMICFQNIAAPGRIVLREKRSSGPSVHSCCCKCKTSP